MRFWDASAIVPLLVAEASTPRLQALAASDPDMLVWWGSRLECVSALARLEREAAFDPQGVVLSIGRPVGTRSTRWISSVRPRHGFSGYTR